MMLQQSSAFMVLSFLALLKFLPVVNGEECKFCSDDYAWRTTSYAPSDRAHFYIEDGKTCKHVYDEVQKSDDASTQCNNARTKYREICCGTGPATQAPQTNKALSPSSGKVTPQGKEPVCNICKNGAYPKSSNTMIYSNYIPGGSCSCGRLSWLGKNRRLGGAVCYPLQLYVQGPCKCPSRRLNMRGLSASEEDDEEDFDPQELEQLFMEVLNDPHPFHLEEQDETAEEQDLESEEEFERLFLEALEEEEQVPSEDQDEVAVEDQDQLPSEEDQAETRGSSQVLS